MAVPPRGAGRDTGNIGHAIQIIDITMNQNRPSRISLHNANIKAILDSVGDRGTALISVAGPSRLGKSFLLSFMVRYLRALENGDSTDWIGRRNPRKTLEGFHFQNGIERMTTGMWLWSRPFIIKNDAGEEIAVLLMDTQGVFDDHTTMKEWSAIVGISLLTSSCLIYNVVNNLQEDSLSIMETFLQFGMLAMEQSDSADACYQKLIFLIRDWNMPDECEYGSLGGQKFLEKKLKIVPHLPPSSVRVRETIKRCFEEIDCFLMPDPGEDAKGNDFKGSLEELDEKFVKNLMTFMENLLSPEQIAVKKVDGQPMKARNLLTYFQKYVTLFNSSGIPTPTNMQDATAHATCDVLVSKCLSSAKIKFLEILNHKGFINEGEWEAVFNPLKIEALKEYDAQRKFGDPKIAQQQRRRLDGELSKLLAEFKEKQEGAINERSNTEQNKLIQEFTAKLSQYLETGFLLKDQFEKMIFQETEISIKSFGGIFGNNKVILGRSIPILTQNLKTVADQFRVQNTERFDKATESANSALGAALIKYQDDMELRILQIGDKIIQDELLLKFDSAIRSQSLSFYRSLPKVGPQEFFSQFEIELESKINEKFAQIAGDISKKRQNMQSETQKLIAELTQMYIKEMPEILSLEAAPDDLFLENKHLQLQNKYFDVFIAKSNIQDVGSLLPYKQTLTVSLQQALELVKQKLLQKQNETRNHISTEIENLVQSHHKNIFELLNEQQICTEQYLRNTHAKVVEFCQSELNLPSFLKVEEKKRFHETLLSNLKQDFDSLFMSYQTKLQEAEGKANNITADIMENYQRRMDEKVYAVFEKLKLDECHMKEKNISENEFINKVQFLPPEILNEFQGKLDFQLDETYEIFVDRFERNMAEMNEHVMTVCQNSITKYSEIMAKKGQTNLEQEGLMQWHDLYKEKALTSFDRELRSIKMNCDSQRKKLERQLSEEFQSILLIRNANEQEMKVKAEKHLDDSLAKYKRDAQSLIDEEKFKDEVAFMKKLNDVKIITRQYFYENGVGIRRELLNKAKKELEDAIEGHYDKICNDFTQKRDEESIMINTNVATALSKYRSFMDNLFLETSALMENSQFELMHKTTTHDVIQDIPVKFLPTVSPVVKKKIDKMYENYKMMQQQRQADADNKLCQFIAELKLNISEIVAEKSSAAKDTNDLRGLEVELKEKTEEKLKSTKVCWGNAKPQFLVEITEYIQETLKKAKNKIKSRELPAKNFTIFKDSDDQKPNDGLSFLKHRVADGHQNIATKQSVFGARDNIAHYDLQQLQHNTTEMIFVTDYGELDHTRIYSEVKETQDFNRPSHSKEKNFSVHKPYSEKYSALSSNQNEHGRKAIEKFRDPDLKMNKLDQHLLSWEIQEKKKAKEKKQVKTKIDLAACASKLYYENEMNKMLLSGVFSQLSQLESLHETKLSEALRQFDQTPDVKEATYLATEPRRCLELELLTSHATIKAEFEEKLKKLASIEAAQPKVKKNFNFHSYYSGSKAGHSGADSSQNAKDNQYYEASSVKPEFGLGIHFEASGATVSLFQKNKIEKVGNIPDLVIGYQGQIVIHSNETAVGDHYINLRSLFEGNIDQTFKVNWDGTNYEFRFEECISMILSRWRYIYQKSFICHIKTCVIAVPSYLSDIEARAMRDAAQMSGFEHIKILRDISAAVVGLSFFSDTKYFPKKFVMINVLTEKWDAGLYDITESLRVKVISGDNFTYLPYFPSDKIKARFQSFITDIRENEKSGNASVDVMLLGNGRDDHSLNLERARNCKGVQEARFKDGHLIASGCAFIAALMAGDVDAAKRWQERHPNSSNYLPKYHWSGIDQPWDEPLKNRIAKRKVIGINLKREELLRLQQRLRQFVLTKEEATEEANGILLSFTKKVKYGAISEMARNALNRRINDVFTLLRKDSSVADIDRAIQGVQQYYEAHCSVTPLKH